MIGKIILSITFVAVLCQISFAEEPVTNKNIAKVYAEFDLNVDGTKKPYRIDVVLLNYYIPHLKISRNKETHSADIKLGALLSLEHGDIISDVKEYTPYTFIRSQFLNVDIKGTAQLVHDSPYLKNCQFSFTQVPPIRDEVPALVKQTILGKLNEFIGDKLCHSINETI